jgi:aspartate/methionine/tyrosine aminotransferase
MVFKREFTLALYRQLSHLVITTGTFSKTIAHGLRVGWVLGSPALVAACDLLKFDKPGPPAQRGTAVVILPPPCCSVAAVVVIAATAAALQFGFECESVPFRVMATCARTFPNARTVMITATMQSAD